MRKMLLVLVVVLAAVGLWFSLQSHPTYRLSLRTYFHHAQSLQPGTPVWVDGVEVGSVTSISVRPELSELPVEVLMETRTPYDLRIRGSIVSLSAQGVLGPAVLEIDTRRSTGPPVLNGGILKSAEVTDNQAAHAMEVVGNSLIEASKKLREKDQSPATVTPAK
jgi:ABC-type transporter Mla subunit MlaD